MQHCIAGPSLRLAPEVVYNASFTYEDDQELINAFFEKKYDVDLSGSLYRDSFVTQQHAQID